VVVVTRRVSREQRSDEILGAALEEFNEMGFHGASTRSITGRLGISSGLLFHYFPSKEALFEELVRIGCRELAIDVAAASEDPVGFLHGAVEHVLGMLRERPQAAAMFMFMSYVESHPGLTPEADRLMAEHELVAASLPVFEAGRRRGVLRDAPPLALASTFWSALQGVAQEHAAHPERPLPEADWLLAIVTRGEPS